MYPGIDIINIERFARACERRPRLKERLFTRRECEALNKSPTASWAVRFAGKEAVLKALGTGLTTGLCWHDIEILTEKTGEPRVDLSPKAQALVHRRGGTRIQLSLSHERDYAVAMAILE